MRDTTFGRISGRQLTLRWIIPWRFEKWTEIGREFDKWRLFNPLCWLMSLLRGDYRVWWVVRSDCNHRCYCPVGFLFDGSVVIAGWGVVWFYQNKTGEVPCVCVRVCEEMFCDEECESADVDGAEPPPKIVQRSLIDTEAP
jgi:hypothetical protein